MATRIRDGIPGNEKTLSQQANPAPRRASTNPSPSLSRPIGAKSTAPSSDRSVPSHPKPTRNRLGVDQPTKPAAAKKPAAAATSDKSSFARLRSFDKSSPPVSPSPRTHQSPNPKEKIMRPSSSFSGSRSTATTLQKGASNRLVKPAAKKSNNVTTNKYGGSTASSARASRSSSIISSPERVEHPEIVNVPHPQEDDPQTSVTDEEVSIDALSSHVTNEQVPIDASSKHEMTADIVKEEKQQKTDLPVQAQPDIHEQKDIKIIKSLTSKGSNKTEAKDHDTPGKETSSFHLESQQLQEHIEDNSTDPVNEKQEVQAEDQGKEEVKSATKVMKKEEVKEEDQVVIMKETKGVKNIASPEPEPKLELQSEPRPEQEQKPESEPALAPAPVPEEAQTVERKRPIIVQGKKDAAAVSNDVIEETASKLQEQKKNRVRALAGAFETVISLQEK